MPDTKIYREFGIYPEGREQVAIVAKVLKENGVIPHQVRTIYYDGRPYENSFVIFPESFEKMKGELEKLHNRGSITCFRKRKNCSWAQYMWGTGIRLYALTSDFLLVEKGRKRWPGWRRK